MKKIFLLPMLAIGLTGLLLLFAPVMGTVNANPLGSICDPAGDGSQPPLDPVACGISDSAAAENRVASIITTVTQTLVFVIGGLSVLMIIVGGVRYVVSGGDSNAVNGAKNTIMYAIIGLAVAMVAQGLVTFVLARL